MSDKGDTFIFKPEESEKKEPEKEKIARTEVDEFTLARKTVEYDEEEEEVGEKASGLSIAAAILGVLLVLAVVGLIIYLNSDKGVAPPQEVPQQESVNKEDDKEEEEEEEVEELVVENYTLAYNGGKIYEMENGGYSVVFDVYNTQNKKDGQIKLYINDETVIKDNNLKIGNSAFINFLENQGGDILLLECEVREDNVILSVKYNSTGYGDEEETVPEDDSVTEETPEAEETPAPEKPSVQEPPAGEETPSVETPPASETPAETESPEE